MLEEDENFRGDWKRQKEKRTLWDGLPRAWSDSFFHFSEYGVLSGDYGPSTGRDLRSDKVWLRVKTWKSSLNGFG